MEFPEASVTWWWIWKEWRITSLGCIFSIQLSPLSMSWSRGNNLCSMFSQSPLLPWCSTRPMSSSPSTSTWLLSFSHRCFKVSLKVLFPSWTENWRRCLVTFCVLWKRYLPQVGFYLSFSSSFVLLESCTCVWAHSCKSGQLFCWPHFNSVEVMTPHFLLKWTMLSNLYEVHFDNGGVQCKVHYW